MIARPANRADAAAIARIYNQGIEDRTSTFETRPRTAREIEAWFDGRHPIIVIDSGADALVRERPPGRSPAVIAFAATSQYRPRDCYAGIAEFSVYVDRDHRGKGAGTLALRALIESASNAGFWKLVSRVFPDNVASLRLLRSLGFREVGTYERHGRLDGVWRDVVIVERLLNEGLY